MEFFNISKKEKSITGLINITGSKSESNRLLILKKIYKNKIILKNISDSEDTKILKKSLYNNEKIININHAGTAMRFLTAYFSSEEGKNVILTGSSRMKNRPIKILVDTLNNMGAKIEYLEKDGFPPIRIIGKKLKGGKVKINSNVSSQYISAIMLIAPKLEEKLEIKLLGKITSYPYINMTLQILKKIGIYVKEKDRKIVLFPKKDIKKLNFCIESDWSSASYYYSLCTFSENCNLYLKMYKKKSLQGDMYVHKIYENYFGIKTIFHNDYIFLHKKKYHKYPKFLELDLNYTPDIAQTIVVTCAGLKIKCIIKGLETLKIKETDRLKGLKNELLKIGIKSNINKDSIEIVSYKEYNNKKICINTYKDHRMAMSFSTLGILYPIKIFDPKVVKKSYKNFWEDMEKIGFDIKK
ncbi:3-phosphoshikimate 1-carboxyvinyltransferase [Candidatus Shikimatogenerans silvanidophilus]|uniref:3-phosphoshikimate 1-carboxyvinyltransferase n=1 Tax=Candidatus Shikimatogenerans silvanidophilus TaxID=2782547 RepID=UPI001BA8DB3D|nr:3-phosphoshikimate 1-carboxyvinyltransferase [Candidatus Shikimatogenerans silvanidophilus]